MSGRRTWELLFRNFGEVVRLALVGGAAAVPEEEPLQCLAALKIVFKPKFVVFVFSFQKVEQFCGCLHDCERGRLVVVDEDWNAAFIVRERQLSPYIEEWVDTESV